MTPITPTSKLYHADVKEVHKNIFLSKEVYWLNVFYCRSVLTKVLVFMTSAMFSLKYLGRAGNHLKEIYWAEHGQDFSKPVTASDREDGLYIAKILLKQIPKR